MLSGRSKCPETKLDGDVNHRLDVDMQLVVAGVLNMARMWETPSRTMGGLKRTADAKRALAEA